MSLTSKNLLDNHREIITEMIPLDNINKTARRLVVSLICGVIKVETKNALLISKKKSESKLASFESIIVEKIDGRLLKINGL